MKPSLSCYKVGIITLAILILYQISSSSADYGDDALTPYFYTSTCPSFFDSVRGIVTDAINKEARMGASLLRLHFHDCFVNGCDGSVLLDDTPDFKGEKSASGNMNSIRGFEVIDAIKADLEEECPEVVSCADILAMAAMISVRTLGGLGWWVELGRRDAKTASQADANRSLPAPTLDLKGLISNFQNVGLSKQDMVTLSGGHTIGLAKCKNFKGRLYNENNMIDRAYAQGLKRMCPKRNGTSMDDNFAHLDYTTEEYFDNNYYTDILYKKVLLHSDYQLSFVGGHDRETHAMVMRYSRDRYAFMKDFAAAMIRMGRISPLLGTDQGEIRKNCRQVNSE